MLRIKGVPRTRPNDPKRILSGGLKFITECDKYVGYGDTRQESFEAWKEARKEIPEPPPLCQPYESKRDRSYHAQGRMFP